MFLDNKYSKIYFKIIERAKNTLTDGYVEKHHIIPRSLGGTDLPFNIVKLSGREHFLAHLLLTKMTHGINKRKMSYAFSFMLVKNDRLKGRIECASRWYEHSRRLLSETQLGRQFSAETKLKMKLSANKKYLDVTKRQIVSSWTKNPSLETRQKISIAAKNRSEESLSKMRLAKSKPCTLDNGNTVFPSKKKLAEKHGWGIAGTASRNFRYLTETERSLFLDGDML